MSLIIWLLNTVFLPFEAPRLGCRRFIVFGFGMPLCCPLGLSGARRSLLRTVWVMPSCGKGRRARGDFSWRAAGVTESAKPATSPEMISVASCIGAWMRTSSCSVKTVSLEAGSCPVTLDDRYSRSSFSGEDFSMLGVSPIRRVGSMPSLTIASFHFSGYV